MSAEPVGAATARGIWAYEGGAGPEACPYAEPMMAALWRSGWGRAAAEALGLRPSAAGADECRRRLGWNFRAIAEKTRLSKGIVREILKGRYRWGPDCAGQYIERIVAALDSHCRNLAVTGSGPLPPMHRIRHAEPATPKSGAEA